MERRRFREEIYSIGRIETAGETTGHFHILLLILTYRNLQRLMDNNIGGHQGRVSQQTSAYAMFITFIKNLFLYIAFTSFPADMQLLTGLILKGSRTHQLADTGVHIQI